MWTALKPRRHRAAITALVAVALGGCGGGGHGAQRDSASDGFLGRLSSGLIYVEWTVSGSQLAGTLYQDLVQRQRHGPETVRADHAVLAGTVVGDRLILSINGAANIAGAFHGARLVLDYPDPQHSTLVGGLLVGSVLVLGMQPSTARAYHQALGTLQRQVAVANATAQRR
jgi:hypothetical protein